MEKSSEFQRFRKIIRKNFTPMIYVCATQKAKEICQENSLSPAELLRPFGTFQDVKMTIRLSEKDRVISIPQFQLNFIDAEEFTIPHKHQIDDHIKNILKIYAPDTNTWLGNYTTEEEIPTHLTQAQPFWFDKIVDVLFNFAKYSYDVNYLEQPISIIYMVSASDSDPVKNLIWLINEHQKNLSKMYSQVDLQSVPKINMILCEKNNDHSARVLQTIENEFPNALNKIVYLGAEREKQEYVADIVNFWDTFAYYKYNYKPPSPNNNSVENSRSRGIFISKAEREIIGRIVHEILMKVIFPFFEKKIQYYESIVSKKKGFMNVAKNLFKPKDKSVIAEGSVMNTEEASIRLLADTYFLLEEYEQAYSNYKLLQGEIKGKTVKLLTNCTEMMFLSRFILDSGNPKRETSFRNCYDNYYSMDARNPNAYEGKKFALRALIFHLYESILGNKKEELNMIIDSFSMIKEIFPSLIPVFREQYAFGQIKLNPPMIRKYATEMVFTGYLYNQLNSEKHTIRCYSIANILYEHLGWNLIKEHIGTMLGKNYSNLNDFLKGMKNFREALENIRQTDIIERHNSLLKETFDVILKIENLKGSGQLTQEQIFTYTEELLKLPLPKIYDDTFDLLLDSESLIYKNERNLFKTEKETSTGIYKNTYIDTNSTWHYMGRILNGFINQKPIQNKFEPKEDQLLKIFDSQVLYEKKEHLCTGPRDAYIDDEIFIEVKIENPFKIPIEIKNLGVDCEMIPEDNKPLDLLDLPHVLWDIFDLKLEPLQQRILSIKMVPKTEGTLVIKGLSWELFGIPNSHYFKFKTVSKRNKNKKTFINELKILPKLGKIGVSFNITDFIMAQDQLKYLSVNIENYTNKQIENVYLINSAPNMFGYECKKVDPAQLAKFIKHNIMIRASIAGLHEIRILIKILLEGGIWRYERIAFPLQINSSFLPRYYTTPCYNKRIIGLQFDDILFARHFKKSVSHDINKGLYITKVILLSNKWALVSNKIMKPIYKRKENFLNFYIKDLFNDKDQIGDEIEFQEGINLLDLNTGNGIQIDYKLLQELYKINVNAFHKLVKKDESPESLSLAILWEYHLDEGITNGLSFIYNIPLHHKRLSESFSKNNILDELPLQTKITASNHIVHDFNKKQFCTADVKVSLTNILYRKKLSFKFEAISPDTFQKATDNEDSTYFAWEGMHEADIIDLESCETKDINLKVVFFQPGVYDIFKFRFTFFLDKKTKDIVDPVPFKEIVCLDSKYETKAFNSMKEQYLISIT